MEYDVRELGGSRVLVHIKLDASDVDKAFQKTYQRLADRGGIRGFRPGKAPRSVLERHYNREAIRAEAYETLLNERLQEAFEEADLRPLEQLEIEVGPPPASEPLRLIDLSEVEQKPAQEDTGGGEPEAEPAETEAEDDAAEAGAEGDTDEHDDGEDEEPTVPIVEGEPFEFHTTFMAFPRPKLPEYRGLKLTRRVTQATEEEIGEQVERLRQLNAREVEVERSAVGEGDLVVVDITIDVEEEDGEIRQVTDQQRELVIGQGQYNPPFDRQLIGHVVGQTVEVELDHAADDADADLAGIKGILKAEIKSLKGRELPDLNDEFAREVGDFGSLDELREAIRSQLQEEYDREADREVREQALLQIVQNTEVELPESFVERAAGRSFDTLVEELERAGMSLESFAEATGMDEQALRADRRVRAEVALRLELALGALLRQEEIEVTDEELDQEMVSYAARSQAEVQFIREAAQLQPDFAAELRQRAASQKLLDLIVASAEIEDVPPGDGEGEQADAQPQESDADTVEATAQQVAATEAQESEST